MDLLSIIIIAIGLAMDCFAVSVSKGICCKKFQVGNALKMAFLFGLFQALMPLIGYFVGRTFLKEMNIYDHWIAFGLLLLIGGKMLIEGLKPIDPNCDITFNPFGIRTLLLLSIATSIDAMVSGVIFISYPHYICLAIGVIGGVSFIFSLMGMSIGVHFGKRFRFNVEIIGGIILMSIGIKILIEHLLSEST